MIEYVEILDADRVAVGIIDMAKSVIWHSVYYGVGDFEIYARATEQNIALLKKGYYAIRPNNDEVGIIEGVTVEFNLLDGYMITAVGRFAKILIDRRIIYKLSGHSNSPTILRGNVEIAVRQTVLDNAINCTFDSRRNIPILALAALKGLTPIIVDENGHAAQKQVSYKNLMEYTDSVLQEYGMSANVIYNDSNKKLLYSVFMGTDRSTENTAGNDPIIFSIEYDNLNSSTYDLNDENYRNAALIGGAGEGLDRFYSLLRGQQSGLQLREMFVDASSVERTYKEEGSEEEHTYTDAEYTEMLNQQGNVELQNHLVQETFVGEINASFGVWKYGQDYFLGDIVTVQDNLIGKYINTRITEVTEVQDESGYKIDLVFGE